MIHKSLEEVLVFLIHIHRHNHNYILVEEEKKWLILKSKSGIFLFLRGDFVWEISLKMKISK